MTTRSPVTTLFRRAATVLAGTALLLPVLAAPAAAHVTANPDEANSPYFRTTLRIGHGCEGSPTVGVRVQIPDGVTNPRAEVVTGWEVETVAADEDGASDDDDDGHGSGAAVAEIAWVGGNLPDSQFQEFGLSFRINDDAPEVLWFPTIQECEQGEHRWIEVPASVDEWGDLDEPAPYVINNVGAGGDGHGDDADGEAEDTGASGTVDDPPPAAAEDDGAGPLPVLALIAGLLGLIAGLAALVVALRRTSPAAEQ